ncbi:unnamed protein product [Nesidiocoris tenuis]|uniref:SOCS box domain-containing protein n=1 Tax=Nesidiocoris tenuis TaxID=355587 RepID=A0A6H5H177_9HEMI|nr:unnamed protein product [Nesidiocoris tenuis]
MESYGRFTPATVAVQAVRPDVLLFLLQYGAQVYAYEQPCPLEALLRRLSESPAKVPPDLQKCQDIIMRSVATVGVPDTDHPYVAPYLPGLQYLPDDRTVSAPPLKHLCRCQIRKSLNANYELPHGIYQLRIPEDLKSYLNLEDLNPICSQNIVQLRQKFNRGNRMNGSTRNRPPLRPKSMLKKNMLPRGLQPCGIGRSDSAASVYPASHAHRRLKPPAVEDSIFESFGPAFTAPQCRWVVRVDLFI